MAFILTARWPHGTYLGHRPDGTPEALPGFARVFSALVHAGSTGCVAADDAAPSDTGFRNLTPGTVSALSWLEEHPPTAMAVPEWPDFIPSRADLRPIRYRAEGAFHKEGPRTVYKKTPQTIGEASWIGAPLSWIWDEAPPRDVRQQIDELCRDVGVLGEADSPVVLEVFDATEDTPRTHSLETASFFDPGGITVDVPATGRLQALEEQFSASNPVTKPSIAADKTTLSNGLPRSEAPTAAGLRSMRLRPLGEAEARTPWPTVVLLPVIDGPVIDDAQRVDVAVALHRALIAVIGQECPAIVTGRYSPGVAIPANRVALHWIPAGAPLADGRAGCAHLAVMLPAGIADTESDAVHRGIARLRPLRTRAGTLVLDAPSLSRGDQFWAAPAEGTVREWSTDPAAVPERMVKGRDPFEVLALSAAWSLGNVLRAVDDDAGVGSARARLQQLERTGGAVLEASAVIVSDPTRYVHRTNRTMPVMPYRARLQLGAALPDTAVLAIGQSRHLGGGLLVPVDRRQSKETRHA